MYDDIQCLLSASSSLAKASVYVFVFAVDLALMFAYSVGLSRKIVACDSVLMTP